MGARLSKVQVVRSGETRDHLILDTKIKPNASCLFTANLSSALFSLGEI
jgi:hypothetical protein